MHVHVGRKKRHAVQPSVRCCLPANGTSPKYSSTLSVDMLLSDRDTLDNDPLLASREPPAGNCNKSSSVSVSMSRDRRLYTCQQITPRYMYFSLLFFLFFFFFKGDCRWNPLWTHFNGWPDLIGSPILIFLKLLSLVVYPISFGFRMWTIIFDG